MDYKATVDKKNVELDQLYQDNSSVYEQLEAAQKRRAELEAKLKLMEDNNTALSKAQITLR